MHDPLGILEIEALAQQIGGDEDIRLERRDRPGSALSLGRERAQDFVPRDSSRSEPTSMSKHRRDSGVAEPLEQIARGRLRVGEDDRLDGLPGEELL